MIIVVFFKKVKKVYLSSIPMRRMSINIGIGGTIGKNDKLNKIWSPLPKPLKHWLHAKDVSSPNKML